MIASGCSSVVSGIVVSPLSVSVTLSRSKADRLPLAVTATMPELFKEIVPPALNDDACDADIVSVTPSDTLRLPRLDSVTAARLTLAFAVMALPLASMACGRRAVSDGRIAAPFSSSLEMPDRSCALRFPLATSVVTTSIRRLAWALVLPAVSV